MQEGTGTGQDGDRTVRDLFVVKIVANEYTIVRTWGQLGIFKDEAIEEECFFTIKWYIIALRRGGAGDD
jgi:hypothetical protein